MGAGGCRRRRAAARGARIGQALGGPSCVGLSCVVGAIALLGAGGTTADAAALEPARLKIATSLVDEALKEHLPLALSLPAPGGPAADGGVVPTMVPASLVELRYCGPTGQGAGRFRAAIRIAGIPAGAVPTERSGGSLIGDADCRSPLGDLGKRVAADQAKDDAAVVLADFEATWHAWELRLAVARFVVTGGPRSAAAAGWGDAHRDVLAFSTAGIVVPTDLGPLVFHAAPTFAADGLEIAAALGEPGAPPPAARPAPGSATAFPFASVSAANATIELPYALANQLLRTFTARPLPVRVGRETIDVQNASLRGGAAGVTVATLATSRAVPESMRVSVTTAGDDLRVGAVRADPQTESCAGLGMMAALACNARNAARTAAAAALGAAATDRYQNQLVRELAGSQDVHLGVARRELRLTGELIRIAPTARGLLIDARLTPRER